eukprot:1154863-Pelagomonas_calceolata.AAC.2
MLYMATAICVCPLFPVLKSLDHVWARCVSISGCLALRTGSLLMVVFHQLASGTSLASLEWRGSMISLLTQNGGLVQLRFVEGMFPNVQQMRVGIKEFGVWIGAHWTSPAW